MLTYNRSERLKSRKLIDELFSSGSSFSKYPLKVFFKFLNVEGSAALQGGVGVGSKKFKRAVDRNRIKRLIREAYRLQKRSLEESLGEQNKRLVLFFIYTGKELPLYDEIVTKTGELLKRLISVAGTPINTNT